MAPGIALPSKVKSISYRSIALTNWKAMPPDHRCNATCLRPRSHETSMSRLGGYAVGDFSAAALVRAATYVDLVARSGASGIAVSGEPP